MRCPWGVHPLLVGAFPVLFLLAHNINELYPSAAYVPLAVMTLGVVGCWLMIRLLVRNPYKASLVVSWSILLIFSYGQAYQVIRGFRWVIGSITVGPNQLLFPLWCVLLTSGLYGVVTTARDLRPFTLFLNKAAALLIAASLGIIGWRVVVRQAMFRHLPHVQQAFEHTTDGTSTATGPLRDIYYIILDRYASANVLKEYYGFDNHGFLDYLSAKGFYVAPDSQANYINTIHSLASSLNMEYLTALSTGSKKDSSDLTPVYDMLQDYAVWRFLKSWGYIFVHIGSWCSPTNSNRYADRNLNLSGISEFGLMVYRMTVFYPLAAEGGWWGNRLTDRYTYWRVTLGQLKALAKIPTLREPTFTIAHLLITHEPYLFAQDGRLLTVPEVESHSEQENYVNQVRFTNTNIMVLVDSLLARSTVQPVIILQADEGPLFPRYARDIPNFDWQGVTTSELRQKMGILNAYYLPGVEARIISPSMTPVNSFRMIFNAYFGTRFELLPDEYYAFENWHHPYHLFSITNRLKRVSGMKESCGPLEGWSRHKVACGCARTQGRVG